MEQSNPTSLNVQSKNSLVAVLRLLGDSRPAILSFFGGAMNKKEIPGFMAGFAIGGFVFFIVGHLFTIMSLVYADPIEVKQVQVQEVGK